MSCDSGVAQLVEMARDRFVLYSPDGERAGSGEKDEEGEALAELINEFDVRAVTIECTPPGYERAGYDYLPDSYSGYVERRDSVEGEPYFKVGELDNA